MSAFRVAFVTIAADKAEELSERLVENQLAACVNIVKDICSVYRWDGEVTKDNESLMIIKTAANKIESMIKFVKENHPHDIPEVISLDIAEGNPDYLNWVHKETWHAVQKG
ncbi:MAG: divalent-cation tolerance protein CutA [Candidatus Zixiibacteriota bacterium]|nr:MAG: divalent-cation tolerance protein CutA [candidate division Zixibacteria bacterium]